jgi:hypothetical protein
MRLAASLFLVTALTAPSVALASVASLKEDLAAIEIELTWSAEREEADRVALTDPVITGDRLRIEAEHLLYDESTGGVTLVDARFFDRREAKGTQASAGELIARNVRSFHLVNQTEICDPRVDRDHSPAMIEMRGFTVTPDHQAARQVGAERFSMERIVLRSRVADDGSCVTFEEAAMEGVTSVSPGRDTATIESITMQADFDGRDTATFDFELLNLTAFDPSGRSVASLARMAVSTNVTGDMPESLPTDPGAAFDLLLRTSGNVDLEIRDLYFDAPPELGGQELRGHVVARLSLAEDAIDTELDFDIQGLARLHLDLGLQLLPEGQAGGLSAMMGDEPGLAAAERLAITRLRFSAADQGAVDIAEETAGMGREKIMAELRRRLAVAPQSLVEPTMSFVEAVLDGGAGFRADPPQPVALTQIIMTGMLQPNMLASILAISPE